MTWKSDGKYTMRSPTGHTVAKFYVAGRAVYRASYAGQFIGPVCGSFEEARAVAEVDAAGRITAQDGSTTKNS